MDYRFGRFGIPNPFYKESNTGRNSMAVSKNTVEITCTVQKTIQEKQFEPLLLSASIRKIVPEENVDTAFDELYVQLEENIGVMFNDRGLTWGKK